jgi:putative endopeptidase
MRNTTSAKTVQACLGACVLVLVSSIAPATAEPGLDLAGMDRSTVPGDDFFKYANGTWLESTPIPGDRSFYGPAVIVAELTAQRIADLIRQIAAGGAVAAGSTAGKIGDYYGSFMDDEAIERKGLQPLESELAQIAAIADRGGLAQALGRTLRADVDPLNNEQLHTDNLFGLWVAQDLDDPSGYSPFLLQGGLGMPDREYYLNASPSMAEIRGKYQIHIAAVLKLAHVPDADEKAAKIFDLEHRMAAVHLSSDESEDVLKGNNHWTRNDFERRASGLEWGLYFAAAGLKGQERFVVWQPGAVAGLSALVASQPLEAWKSYLTFRAIEHYSAYLPSAFVREQFTFYSTTLSGTPELRPRWKRAVDATNEALGEAVGKLYVRRYFKPAEKARAENMVHNLLTAFAARIDSLEWMSAQTKLEAKAKLAALKVGLGYPDHWRDYSGLKVIRGDALGNARRSELFEYLRNLAKLGRAVDRSEWVMTPQTVNAVNLPAMNALNFPAAVLQPPGFDAKRGAALNYGAIGAVIGHEISHSFDDQGALFDAHGRLRNWWTPEDLARFKSAAARLINQYDAYRPFPDVAVNGKQTLGENIADLSGLAMAYDAYHLSLRSTPSSPTSGLTGDQTFFLSFAQLWRRKFREPALRQLIAANEHAPAEYRADTVRNIDAWYSVFNVKPGQKLYLAPEDRVRFW